MTKWVYGFGGGSAEGNAGMRDLLGGVAHLAGLGVVGRGAEERVEGAVGGLAVALVDGALGARHERADHRGHGLAGGAEVEELTVEHAGGSFTAKRITIRPFATDPNLDRFPGFAEKWYEFVLAPGIPGGLYRIRSVVPSQTGGVPLIENSLTYSETET